MNQVCIIGNLCADPELRSIPSGTSVCKLRVAVNGRRKDASGEWVDDPNFFDVTVWGNMAENCAKYLEKGRSVGISGRLNWHSWETTEGAKRSAVDIIAHEVKFLGSKDGGGGRRSDSDSAPTHDDFQTAPAGSSMHDDDIPF